MGQALRRVVGRIRTPDPAPPAPPAPPVVQVKRVEPQRPANFGDPKLQTEYNNVLEQREPNFDAMLSRLAGRITTKTGGKHEMGEAQVMIVERYNRPMPKLRNTKAGPMDPRAPVPGTLDIAMLKELLIAHQGKSSDDYRQLAEKFKIDPQEIEKLLRHVSFLRDVSKN